MAKNKVEWTNPDTNEKFVHTEKDGGSKHLYYGPKDTPDDKNHGHAVFDSHGNVLANRKPRGE